MPHLQALALKVYSQPISQSTVEQLFSIYEGIMGPNIKETNYPSPRKFQMRRAYPYLIFERVRVFSRSISCGILCRTAQQSLLLTKEGKVVQKLNMYSK